MTEEIRINVDDKYRIYDKDKQQKYRLWKVKGGIWIERTRWELNPNCISMDDWNMITECVGLRDDYIDQILGAIQKLKLSEDR